jgi:acetaldehyde dehydrogenase (acetylating)
MDQDLLSVQQARDAVVQAYRAYETLKTFNQEKTDKIVAAMAEAILPHAERLAKMAVEDTGFGRYEDKIVKNKFATVSVHEYIRDMKTAGYIRRDEQSGIAEIAVPMGVVAAIIPSTNPTSTAIYKALISIKSRNSVVMSPHPKAVRCIAETSRILAEAASAAGAPEGAVVCLQNATMEATHELWTHKKTAVILATGGTGLVRAAYSSGKPAYGVGPGNVPAFVERTADIAKAVRDIIAGKSFDWGTLCSSEQSMLVDAPVREQVISELRKNGAHLCTAEEKQQVAAVLVQPNGAVNPELVGRSPQHIARTAGFPVPESTRALIVFLNDVGREEPLSCEKLSPVLGFYTVNGWQEGCDLAIRLLKFGGLGHTLSLHSKDEKVIDAFALEKPAFRIIVNSPSTMGAVGLTTGLAPAMTLGPGSWGGSITSDNITPMHLVHIKRVAREIRSAEEVRESFVTSAIIAAPVSAPAAPEPADENVIDIDEIHQLMNRFEQERKTR